MDTKQLVFHLSGDDHETRTLVADTEEDARSRCADGFNGQYPCECDAGEHNGDDCEGADYNGAEFDLLGVYEFDEEIFSEDDEDMDVSELTKVTHWPK